LTAPTKRSMDGSLSRLGPPDEALEVARLAAWSAVAVFAFALASIAIVLSHGDLSSAFAAVVQFVVVGALIYARRQVLQGRSQRGVTVLVVSVLAAVLAMAPLPPPIPALAAAPIMAVAFALSYLDGRRLKAVLIITWVVSVVTAIIVEFTPASPDMPAEFAVGLRIGTLAAVVGLVGLVLFRHRRRLENAARLAHAAIPARRAARASPWNRRHR